jgi:TgpA N-terminal domain
MRSVSSEAVPARPSGRLAIAGAAILLAAITAGSAATAAYILGLSGLPTVAFLGGLTVAGLALSKLRLRWALPLSLLAGIAVSLMAAGWDPWQAPSHSLRELHGMLRMIQAGTAGDTTAPDFLFFLAFWGTAAWLGWFAIRARRPLIAMVPSVAIIFTDVLNVPADQATYVLGLVVCCCALLLITSYERSVGGARSRGVWLHDDVRWNFWEMGVAVSVLVLAVTALAPPVSTVDRTLALQNTLFPGNNPGQTASGEAGAEPSTGTMIGYSRVVRLLGPLQKSNQIVFTYSRPTGATTPGCWARTRSCPGRSRRSSSWPRSSRSRCGSRSKPARGRSSTRGSWSRRPSPPSSRSATASPRRTWSPSTRRRTRTGSRSGTR